MRSIIGYGKTIAFILTVMLPAPSLAAIGWGTGTLSCNTGEPVRATPAPETLTPLSGTPAMPFPADRRGQTA